MKSLAAYLSFEIRGMRVAMVDVSELTQGEMQIVYRIGKPRQTLRAQSAECDPEFTGLYSTGSIAGMYRLSPKRKRDRDR